VERARAAAVFSRRSHTKPKHTPNQNKTTALRDASTLFRHDVAFCLGQRQDPAAIAALAALLADHNEHPMVRHEAGEALGAIGAPACLAALRAHADDAAPEVAETCRLALERIEHMTAAAAAAAAEAAAAAGQASSSNGGGGDSGDPAGESPFMSVDPTPPYPASTPVEELRAILLDPERRMFDVRSLSVCVLFVFERGG
jgi:deoxyhypusine monooxygenase